MHHKRSAPFPDLKAGHVDHLLSYTKGLHFLGLFIFSRKCYNYVVNCIFSKIINIYISKPMRLPIFFKQFLSNSLNHVFFKLLRLLIFYKLLRLLYRKFNVNAVDCSSVLKVTCPCCVFLLFFVIPFFALFPCFFYISDSLSCTLNSVL